MNTQPLLAVIVPVYKVEKYIHQCIDSILSQSYTALRVILVDDGSPDRCGAICDEYAAIDPRVVVAHKENGGISSARNAGLEKTTECTYVTFVDSDDYLEPGVYSDAITYLESHPDVGVIGLGINEVRKEGVFYCGEKDGIFFDRESALNELVQGFSFKLGPSVWSKVFRREAIGDIRFREGYVYEDNSFSLEVLARVNAYYLSSCPGYNYRMNREGSITSVFDKRMAFLFDNLEELQARRSDDAELCLYANTMAVNYLWMYWYQLYRSAPAVYREVTEAFLPYLRRARQRPYFSSIGSKTHTFKLWLFLHAPYLYTRLSLH